MPQETPGTLDPQTTQLLSKVLNDRKGDLDAHYRDAVLAGDGRRKMTAFLQLEAKDAGIHSGTIDGLWGHVTSDAVEALEYFDTYGKLPARGVSPKPWEWLTRFGPPRTRQS